jgi:LCP family protein required for cell wall assembly
MDRYHSLAEAGLDDPRPFDAPWPDGSSYWRGPQFGTDRPSDGLTRVSVRPVGGREPARRRSVKKPKGPARRRGPGAPGGRGPSGPGGPGDGPRPGKSRRRKILRWASVVTTLVLVAAALAGYAAYRNVVDGIKQVDVSHLLGKRPPQYSTAAMNILVIGSDSRAGTNGQFGSAQAIAGARSDTMMLLHIPPQHRGGVVISFPRDSLAPIIGCQADGMGDKGQTAQPGATEMLNAAFASGGAACLWKTLESSTGIFIDHFVEVNFNGFQSVVNDLGGVNVCLPKAIKDPASGLNLTAGAHHVSGAQALAFVRERHIGEGSDLQRIQRQQFFMAALLQQIDTQQTMSDVPRLYSIARDVAKTLTTDSGLSVAAMLNVAQSMKGLTSKAVQFTQVPVIPDQTVAKPPKQSGTATSGTTAPAATTPATAASGAQKIGIKVLNATATAGLAAQAAGSLSQNHFDVIGTGNAVAPSASTIIQYSSQADAAAATALTQVAPGGVVQQVAGITPGTVDLILGSSFTGIKAAAPAPSSSPSSASASSGVSSITKTFGGITGNTNICSNSGAFTGPDVPADFAP